MKNRKKRISRRNRNKSLIQIWRPYPRDMVFFKVADAVKDEKVFNMFKTWKYFHEIYLKNCVDIMKTLKYHSNHKFDEQKSTRSCPQASWNRVGVQRQRFWGSASGRSPSELSRKERWPALMDERSVDIQATSVVPRFDVVSGWRRHFCFRGVMKCDEETTGKEILQNQNMASQWNRKKNKGEKENDK